MILKPSNANDIQRYFSGTFVKFSGFGDRLFYINEVNKDAIHGKDDDGHDFILSLHEEAPFEMDYVLPNRAVYQLGKTVAMLQRIPARQYKRGVCDDNTKLFRPGNGERMDLTLANLKKFVNKPSYRTLRQALYGKSADIEIAITPRFWFRKRDQTLFLDTVPVALFQRDTRKIQTSKLFKQDVANLVSIDPFEVEIV